MPCRIQLKCVGNIEDANITLKWAYIRKTFLEEVVFELSLENFDHVTMEDRYAI